MKGLNNCHYCTLDAAELLTSSYFAFHQEMSVKSLITFFLSAFLFDRSPSVYNTLQKERGDSVSNVF